MVDKQNKGGKRNGKGKGDYQYLYSPNQTLPEAILQEDNVEISDSPFNELLLGKATGRAHAAERLLQQMIDDRKIDLRSGDAIGAKWLRGQVGVEISEGSLLGAPQDYYTLPAKNAIMTGNPAPAQLLLAAKEIEENLSKLGVITRILGTKRYLPLPQVKGLQRNSDVMIAVPGDLQADKELIEIIRRKFEGANSQPLIIENSRQLYDSLLSNLQILEYKDKGKLRTFIDLEKLAKYYGIYITEERSDTLRIATEIYNLQKKIGINKGDKVEPDPLIPDGATIFVATGTRKKYDELREMYEKQGLRVNILPIDMLVDGYISAKEESNSYQGNAAEKIDAAFEAWNSMKPITQVQRLQNLGIKLHEMGRKNDDSPLKEEEIFFISEDSGFDFLQKNPSSGLNISTEMEFDDIAHKIDPRAPFPGPETGPGILGNYGVRNFFKTVETILKRYEKEGHIVTREVTKKSVIALAQLQPHPGSYDAHKRGKARKVFMYSAQTRGSFISDPCPDNGSLEIDNFLIPRGEQKTEAQLGKDWTTTLSPRARAWKGLVYDQQIMSDETKELTPLREKDYSVGIVSDSSHELAKAAIQKLVALNRLSEFKVDVLDAEITKLSDVQTKMLEGKDAVVLAFEPEHAQRDFWKNLWIFSSLVVGEQTRDKFKLEKPLYLINPKDEKQQGAFDYLENLIYDLHILGTIPQDPETLYHSVATVDEAVERLRDDRNNYLRYDPPAYSKGKPIEPEGLESEKDFNVVIFISATNENEKLHSIGKQLSGKLAKEGFGIFSGIGLYGGMGAITKTMVEIRDEHDSHHTGFNVPHIMDGGEVLGKNVEDLVDRFHLCRDIYERIEGLLSADAAIVAPGGMGTIQELAGFALLKKMALDDPENLYTKGFEHKELVIINSLIEIDGEQKGFYDELVKVIPKQEFKKLGIHIVQTPEEAIQKMRELRTQKRERTGGGHTL